MSVTTNSLNKSSQSFTVGTTLASGITDLTLFNLDNTSGTSDAQLRIFTGGTSSGDPYLGISVNTGTSYQYGIDNSASNVLKETTGSAASPSTGTVLRQMTSTGLQTLPLQSAFSAYSSSSASNATGDGTLYTVVCGTELFDQHSDFDGTSTYTAPITARVSLTANAYCQGVTLTDSFVAQITTSNNAYKLVNGANPTSSFFNIFCSVLADMDAADTAIFQVTFTGGAKTVTIYGAGGDIRTNFCGYIAC